ncbi:heme biosynthesis HemY N-terminal domain-containing protein [Sulfuriflexus mobilis]|uniref:heme biosynthesis HemY N-terminal domain-containing protein n=1 Tax=Sulfuriflexus mobilis TaxID=1811807 RepID=UPI000F84710A|nr:heme biosynthesis HemY N-terminal domain-containing protein [Sulfuriflexus mobilis]
MKLLIKILFIALLGVALALLAKQDAGYVLIARSPWAIEISLTLFIVALFAGFVVAYYLIRFLVNSWGLSRRMHDWQERRHVQKARRSLNRGLLELAQRHWDKAEKLLIQHVEHSESPLLNYLAAASAAQEQGADVRRDQFLSKAHESVPGADVAVGLTQADLQLRHGQLEQALATLTHLRSLAPKHPHVLKLLMRLYSELRDWERLHQLLPELRKRKVSDEATLDAVEVRVYGELLNATREQARLQQVWQEVPRRLRYDVSLLQAYVKGLLRFNADETAVTVLHDALKKQWDHGLLQLYARCKPVDVARQLSWAEQWSAQHGKDPVLLEVLGRLAVRNQLWGKARAWFEASIGQSPQPRTYRALGELLERLEEPERAAECYRKGIKLIDSL